MGSLFGLASVILMASGPVINKFILQKVLIGFATLANAAISVLFFATVQAFTNKKLKLRLNRANLLSGVFNSLGLVLVVA